MKQLFLISLFFVETALAVVQFEKPQINPGNINEQTAETGEVDTVYFFSDDILPIKYYFGFLHEKDGKIYIRSRSLSGPVDLEVLNANEISETKLNSEIVFEGKLDETGKKIKVISISSLVEPYEVPAMWCSSMAATDLRDSDEAFSYFFRLDVIAHTRPPLSNRFSMVSSKGKIQLWIFQHPKNVNGSDRFQEQFLRDKKIFQVKADISSAPLDLGGDFYTSISGTDARFNLVRHDQNWKFNYHDGASIKISGERSISGESLSDMVCIGTRGR